MRETLATNEPDNYECWRHDFGAILLCAERYAITRRSYMPGVVSDYIRRNLKHDPQRVRTAYTMARDIRETMRESEQWDEEHPDMAGWYVGVRDFESLLPMLDEIRKDAK